MTVRRWFSALFVAMAVVGAGVAVGMTVLDDDPVEAGETSRTSIVRETTTSSTTTTTTSTTTTTTAPPETTTTAPPPPPEEAAPPVEEAVDLDVQALQQRLGDLGYWVGDVDGRPGHLTTQAVMAFQKANGLERDGVPGPATMEALAVATREALPAPQAVTGDGLEIDLERQILLVVRGGVTQYVLNTSTGTSGWRTVPGDHVVERTIDGMRHAPLGDLYRPAYFYGGQAVHGAASIPGHPASHGCARVSFRAMDMLWAEGFATQGVPVVVY